MPWIPSRVQTGVSYTLAPGSEVEVLETTDPDAATAIDLVGNAFNNTALTTLKMVVFTPIANINVITATAVNPGFRNRLRMLWSKSLVIVLYRSYWSYGTYS